MEVDVKSPGGKVWKAYPKMYINQRTNQMMANPDVQSSTLLDLYLSPQSYDPGQPAKTEGTVLSLKKGETKNVEGTPVRFVSFDVDMSQMDQGARQVAVTGNFEVGAQGAAKKASPKLTVQLGGGGQTFEPATVPGSKVTLKLVKASASEGIAEVEVLGLAGAGDLKPATPESFSVDVTTKPLISLVWAGFYILMSGGLVAMVRRARDAHKAALA
jgi:cytochrome c-type biogenesis protein CcmF